MTFIRPTAAEIRAALRGCAPQLAGEPIQFLGEGWGSWAFTAGSYVLRFPKSHRDLNENELESRVLPDLAKHLSAAIPVPDLYCRNGPNGVPFWGHQLVPGVPLISASKLISASERTGPAEVKLSESFGRDLGVFVGELHRLPVEKALELDLSVVDGAALRADREWTYGEAVEVVFPLVGQDVVSRIKGRFAAYLDDGANFEFEPCLVHGDIERQNTLVDSRTGDLTGIIDFGGVKLSKPALDMILPLGDFDELGIGHQIPAFFGAYGLALDVDRARIEVEFMKQVLWPVYDIEFGDVFDNAEFTANGIAALGRLDDGYK